VLDIQGLLAANAGALDLELVRRELGDVLPDDDERIVQFEMLVHDHYGKG
jgi:hypothetical protein